MNDEEILSLLLIGCKYEYISYDHKKAVKEYKLIDDFWNNNYISYTYESYMIPDELKEKYRVLRIGKLRGIEFNPNGSIKQLKIGYKRNKIFYPKDFGISVKPIIDPNIDKFKLIERGLAKNIYL